MNKHLINAARYLDAVHNVSVDEESTELDKIINKYRTELNSETLNQYWVSYLKDINFYPEDGVNDEDVDDEEEKVVYYRGVAQTVSKKLNKADKAKKITYYRGSKIEEE